MKDLKTVVISLENATERRNAITKQLNEQKMDYILFNAYNVADITNPSFLLLTKPPMKAFMNLNPKRRKMRPRLS